MTVKELIEMLKTCDEESEVIIKDYDDTTGLYVILKAGSNRAGFIKFND